MHIAIIKKGHILTTKSLKEIQDSGVPLEKFYMDAVADTEEEKQAQNQQKLEQSTNKKAKKAKQHKNMENKK